MSSKKYSSSDITSQFAELLADIKNPAHMLAFLQQFMTETELTALAKRMKIIEKLSQGKSYADIQKELKVSSATVANVAPFLETAIADKILYHISVSRWAEKWSKRLTGGK